MTSPLRVASRRSRLAVAQTRLVLERLRTLHRELDIEVVEVTTAGDADTTSPLTGMPDVGVFTKALQEALLEDRADVAVHSLKDLPTDEAAGLCIAAIPVRATPHDVLVTRGGVGLVDLPPGAAVGTGSPRRRLQVLARRPDLEVVDLRGNVDTRLSKVENGTVDAAILAGAGLSRLGLADAATEVLDLVPAPGQGALAVECRADDTQVRTLVSVLDDPDTSVAVAAERAWLAATGAGCRTSAGALATVSDADIELVWFYEGRTGSGAGSRTDPVALGEGLAQEMGG
ncbi:MAG: hydroxymethylbilane synthase [Acidimicrobiia bacterium]|nr:hydroxymethylbilane synthase [Acidimicrobiia bacterium]